MRGVPTFLLIAAVVFLSACEEEAPLTPTTKPELEFATTDDAEFERKRKPGPRDWLARFQERGQSFENYRKSRPVKADQPDDLLAFLPVGPFTKEERAVFEASVEFAGLWFELPTKILKERPLPKEGWQRVHYGVRQYRTGYFLDHLLPDNRPSNAVCLFGVTMADLYPDDDWNFVFGQASLRRRVGVWSYTRYFAKFWKREETTATRKRALRRACRLVVHEAGHAFGLEHCIAYECTMNGSNHLEESDSQPLRLCPPCLKKLQWNRGFDVLRRYRNLAAFHERHGFEKPARWIRHRMGRIRR